MKMKANGLGRGFLALALTLTFLTGASRVACAQLLSDESFNYTPGALAGDKPGTANGWLNNTVAWTGTATVLTGNLSYPASTGLTSTGNSVNVANATIGLGTSGAPSFNSSFDYVMSGSAAGQTLYASYLIDMLATSSSGGFGQMDLSMAAPTGPLVSAVTVTSC